LAITNSSPAIQLSSQGLEIGLSGRENIGYAMIILAATAHNSFVVFGDPRPAQIHYHPKVADTQSNK
jgi:hypothetical protein